MPAPVLVRTAGPEDFAAVADLLVRAFVGGGFTSEDGAERLREVAPRATAMDLLVAVDPATGAILGAVYWLGSDSPWRDIAGDGEGELQLLAVEPAARGRRIGETLVCECLRRARARGLRRVVLSTQPTMTPAHRLYERVGFRRAPDRDWERRGTPRLVYVLDL